MRISKEDKDELEMLIIGKMEIALSAITGDSDAESDQQAAAAANFLSNALLNIGAYMDAEPIEYEEEKRGFVADEWYREEFGGDCDDKR